MTSPLADFADIGSVVDDFSEPFAIERRARGEYDVHGRFTKAPDHELINAIGSVTPATPNDLQRLPEGRRVDKAMRVLTRTELLLTPQADVIVWNGESWEVFHAAPWVGAFFEAFMTKKAQQ